MVLLWMFRLECREELKELLKANTEGSSAGSFRYPFKRTVAFSSKISFRSFISEVSIAARSTKLWGIENRIEQNYTSISVAVDVNSGLASDDSSELSGGGTGIN